MMSPIHGRAFIDIIATLDRHRDINPDLIAAAHELTGCDTVATYFGIGNVALRVLRAGDHALSYIGNTSHM